MASSPFSALAGPFPATAATASAEAVRNTRRRSRSHSSSITVSAPISATMRGGCTPNEAELPLSFESDGSAASASSRFLASAAVFSSSAAALASSNVFAAAASATASSHPFMQVTSADNIGSMHSAQAHVPHASAYFGFKASVPYDLSGASVTGQILAMANLQQQQQQQYHHHALGSNSFPPGLIPIANQNPASNDSANLYPFGLIPFAQDYPSFNHPFMQQAFQATATASQNHEQQLHARLSGFVNNSAAAASAAFLSPSVSPTSTVFAFPANAIPQTPLSLTRTSPKQDSIVPVMAISSATPPTSPVNQFMAHRPPPAQALSAPGAVACTSRAVPGSNGLRGTCRATGARFKPTPADLAILMNVFAKAPYPSAGMRARLAERLGLQGRQIQFWFQNRRAFCKLHGQPLKKPKKGDKLSSASTPAAPATLSPGDASFSNVLTAAEQL
ncbi:hypothetical protein HDU83_001824 [Entophlyctis luteolus]|nr:hypothetical protein HDU83_001824 [Entophlyctis luteolus]